MQDKDISKILFKQTMKNNSYWVLNKAAVATLGIEAAFLLSVFADAEEIFSDLEGWFYQTIETIEEITTLTRRKQNSCIDVLVEKKLIDTCLRGMPARRHFKILHDNATNLFVQNVQTSVHETDKLECAKRTTNKEHIYKANNQSNNNKNKHSSPEDEEVEALFERLWELYPRKEGKMAIKKTTKVEIAKIGFLPMWRAIMRYKWDARDKPRQFTLLGSTFFNSRRADFMDDTYKGDWPEEEPSYSNGGKTKAENDAELRAIPHWDAAEQKKNAARVADLLLRDTDIMFRDE